MTSREELWRKYVDAYDVEVPESAVENELAYVKLAMKHNMQYDRLTGGEPHVFMQRELNEQEDELLKVAMFEAKEPLVLKRIIAEQGFTASREELEREAAEMARREGGSIDMVKRFFGDDLAMLERDVLERKAKEWACEQMTC